MSGARAAGENLVNSAAAKRHGTPAQAGAGAGIPERARSQPGRSELPADLRPPGVLGQAAGGPICTALAAMGAGSGRAAAGGATLR
jgi:hypothetical protein